MTIRRKKRPAGNESTRPAAQVRSEVLQKNLERMHLLAKASASRPANSTTPSQAEREPAYTANKLAGTSESPAASNESDPPTPDPAPAPVSTVEQALAAAGEQVLSAMQEAQKSIMAAESILLQQEASADGGIAEAQKIAEDAVAHAVNQSADALRAAMAVDPEDGITPTSPAPVSPSPIVPDIHPPTIATFPPPVSPEIPDPVLADFPAPVVPAPSASDHPALDQPNSNQPDSPTSEPDVRGQVQ